MESTNKILYTRLTDENKKIAVDEIVKKTKRKKITIKQLWIWGDNIPEEHKELVKNIFTEILRKQKAV